MVPPPHASVFSDASSPAIPTNAEQDALYAKGRTKPGNIVTNAKGSSYRSQHQWGIAFDFYLKMDVDGDGKIADDAYNDSKGHFRKAAEIGKKLGIRYRRKLLVFLIK